MDNGTELTGIAMACGARDRKVRLHFIDPGKPTQNAYIESFDGRFRDECLNTTIATQQVASVFAHDGNPERAARLLGYVHAWYRLRERLSDETFARSVLAGSRIDEDEAIADAIVRPRIPYARHCARVRAHDRKAGNADNARCHRFHRCVVPGWRGLSFAVLQRAN